MPLAIMSKQINQKEVSQMKKLIAVTAIGFTLGFSALSFASDHMDLYVNGPAVKEVIGSAQGGKVETSPMSFYLGDHRVKQAYNPSTFKRLQKIKTQYDPSNLFRMNQNVKPV